MHSRFSTLQRVEIAEIQTAISRRSSSVRVSVLFNESKLLKCRRRRGLSRKKRVSVLFNESKLLKYSSSFAISSLNIGFSTLQRVEIAEMRQRAVCALREAIVSVLFNESKLLKFRRATKRLLCYRSFSTLQRVEIAEIDSGAPASDQICPFQYSSTSRNC